MCMISRQSKSNRKVKKLFNDANDECQIRSYVIEAWNFIVEDLCPLKYTNIFAFIYDQIKNNIDQVDAHNNSD